jgi:transglutaminase-like putative cysteine protease
MHEDVVREEFVFRGVNEIEWTDLPTNELVTWFDLNVNSDLLAAMVTPNDPVVTEFAAAITAKLGGAIAGAGGPDDAVLVMRGLYSYMTETGMRYAGGMGFPEKVGDTITEVQTVRLPRDVIISNNGLCIELALLWASVLEHLGIHSYVILVPGHAFSVVDSKGQYFPIECTAITPKAVGADRPVTFEEANNMAKKELDRAINETGDFKAVDVQELQLAGIQPPELPDINIDQVKHIIAERNAPRFFRK